MKRSIWILLLISLPVMAMGADEDDDDDVIVLDSEMIGVGGASAKPAANPAALPAGALRKSAPATGQKCLTVSPDGIWAVSADNTGKIHFYELATATLVKSIQAHAKGCTAVKFSSDGQSVFSASIDGIVREWNVKTQAETRQFDCKPGTLHSIAVSQDGRLLAAADNNSTIHVWDLKTALKIHSMRGHGRDGQTDGFKIEGLDFSPDGRTLISEANDATARLWDVVNGKMTHTLLDHDGSVAAVAMSSDGVHGASTRSGSIVRLWSATNGAMLRTLVGHIQNISCIVFSPDGEYVYTGSSDQTLRQWHVLSGIELRRWKLIGFPQSVVCSPDGTKVITLSQQDGLVVWDLKSKLTDEYIPISKMVVNLQMMRGMRVLNNEESEAMVNDLAAAATAAVTVDPNESMWISLGNPRYAQRLSAMLYWLKKDAAEAVKELELKLGEVLDKEAVNKVAKAFEGLDDEHYGTRVLSFDLLRSFGEVAKPYLQRGLSSASLQVRVSSARLLRELGGSDDIRFIIVCELLSQIGTPAAREVLTKMSLRECPEATHARAVLQTWPISQK